MFLAKSITLAFISLTLMGCQIGYLVKNGYYQIALLNKRTPIQQVIADPQMTPEIKNKLLIAKDAKEFAENQLGLKQSKNYLTYVQLQEPYVSYSVNAAEKNQLKAYKWSFPIVGTLPYKGYFKKIDAQAEENELKEKGLDTYLRGVRAFSTLGWFSDPLLSSMMSSDEQEIVSIVIHESLHATLYIKSEADFNERLASFVGNKGAELYYLNKEGPKSPGAQKIRDEIADDKIFSNFLSSELVQLEKWYLTNAGQITEELRNAYFVEIQLRFTKEIKPQLKTSSYENFARLPLNNARLLLYKLYLYDLDDFEQLYLQHGQDFKVFIAACKQLENEAEPEKKLRNLIALTQP